jgi:multidrug efflux pump subunit AcrB
VIAPASRRDALSLISGTPLPAGQDGAEPGLVGAFGPVTLEPETALITRIDGQRASPIYAFLDPFVLPAPALARFQELYEEQGQPLPAGYRIAVGGDAENQGDAMADLLSTALPLLTLMIAAVVLAFNSFRYAGVVFVVGFLSAGLAMFGVWMFGTPLGFNAIIGSLGLVGLSINGTIVVLSALRANDKAVAGDPGRSARNRRGCDPPHPGDDADHDWRVRPALDRGRQLLAAFRRGGGGRGQRLGDSRVDPCAVGLRSADPV